MLGKIFGLTVIVILVLLAGGEVRRYYLTLRTPDDFPYPRRRLMRRLAIASIFSAVIALAAFWPKLPVGVQLVLLLMILAGLVLGIVLLWRDLHETSQAAVAHANRLTQQAGEALLKVLPPRNIRPQDKKTDTNPDQPSDRRDGPDEH